jgi:hypothetical protein
MSQRSAGGCAVALALLFALASGSTLRWHRNAARAVSPNGEWVATAYIDGTEVQIDLRVFTLSGPPLPEKAVGHRP